MLPFSAVNLSKEFINQVTILTTNKSFLPHILQIPLVQSRKHYNALDLIISYGFVKSLALDAE